MMITLSFVYSGCENTENSFTTKLELLFFTNLSSSASQIMLKETPTVISSIDNAEPKSSQDQIVSDDPSTIWTLFDSNTQSTYTALETHRFTIPFGRTINLKRMKLFGNTSYALNVYTGSSDSLQLVQELCVNKNVLKDTWNSFQVKDSLKTDSITLEIIPDGATGVREIEIWSEETANNNDGNLNSNLDGMKTYADLETSIKNYGANIIQKSSTPNEISLSGSAEEKATGQLHATIDVNPVVIKRAYLSYEAKNFITPVSIERRINYLSWMGGYDVPKKEGASTSADWMGLIEEINPAWLVSGGNIIEFRTNRADISIRNLKLVLVKDNGWNHVIFASNPEVYDNNDLTYGEITYTGENLEIRFERPVEPESLMILLPEKADAKATIQYQFKNQWVSIKSGWNVDLSKWEPGWNTIQLPEAVATSALRLTFENNNVTSGGTEKIKISEIRACVSPSSDINAYPRMIIGYPRNGEFYGRTAYVQGFVTSNNTAQISIENKTNDQPAQDNSFSISLTKDETKYSSQDDDEKWDPTGRAVALQYSITQTINLTNNILGNSSNSSTGGSSTGGSGNNTTGSGEGYSTDVYPDSAKTITFGPITIEIPAGAVDEKVTITVISLSKEQIAQLNPGMINVTYPAAGYRFLVNGKPHYTFKKSILISFTYSKGLLAQGQADSDVIMYYYDETTKTWKKLNRVNGLTNKTGMQSVSNTSSVIAPALNTQSTTGLGIVVSQTNHFTDIINATLTVPEHPDPLMYNPNSIKDIKVGDPTANVNLIEAPNANNKGEARLNYPIEIPKSRNGMQPQISVNYNSNHKNGWMGIGWDIPIRSIVIDTKFGVPRYNGTEKYLLEGDQLEAIGNGLYQLRVEGSFPRIRRYGNACNNYWWEITDKNGTRYIYGQNASSRLRNYRNPDGSYGNDGNIFMWCLERIIDTNDNNVIYTYYNTTDMPETGGERAAQIYLESISYTGIGMNPGPYRLVFNRDDGKKRPDRIINCRSGFKVITKHRLDSIDVMLNSNYIRKYVFEYEQENTRISRLQYIKHYGEGNIVGDDNLFNTHGLKYFDDNTPGNNQLINGFNSSGASVINSSLNNVNLGDINYNTGTHISANAYLGICRSNGLLGYDKSHSVGITIGSSQSDTKTKVLLIDIDGDNLLDQVYAQNDGIYYKKNLYNAGENIVFSSPVKINFLLNNNSVNFSDVGYSKGNTNISGTQFHFGDYSFINDVLDSTSTIDSYFIDVNGDGLVDYINNTNGNNEIYYNHGINSVGHLEFTTVRPEDFGSGDDLIDLSGVNLYTPTREELLKKYFRDDPILMWEAPYDGMIQITGDVRLIPKSQLKNGTNEYTTNDGVRVSIQKGTSLLWSGTLQPQAEDPIVPAGVDSVAVTAGEQVYFRVNSIDDGAFDCVEWNPVIEYKGIDTGIIDENLLPVYHYEAKSDFSIAGAKSTSQPLMNGQIRINGSFIKDGVTSDDIIVKIFKKDNEGVITDIINYTIAGEDTGEISLGLPVDINTTSDEQLYCQLYSDTPIDWSKISFKPYMEYIEIEGVDSVVDQNGNPLYVYEVPISIDLFPIQDREPITPYTVPSGKVGNARIIYKVEPLNPQDPLMPDDYSAHITLAIKKDGRILAKQKGEILKNSSGIIILDTELSLAENDKLYFVCTSDKNDISRYAMIGLPTIYHEADNDSEDGLIKTDVGVESIGMVYRKRDAEYSFAGGYRSWYFARWNGEKEILDPSQMVNPDIDSIDGINDLDNLDEADIEYLGNEIGEKLKTFTAMKLLFDDIIKLNKKELVWNGMDQDCWIGKVQDPNDSNNTIFALSSTRVIKKHIPLNGENNPSVITSRGVSKIVRNVTARPNFSSSNGFDPFLYLLVFGSNIKSQEALTAYWGVMYRYAADIYCYNSSIVNSFSYTTTVMDVIDFNGDKYPDIIFNKDNNNGVYFTNPDGSLDNSFTSIQSLPMQNNTGISSIVDFTLGPPKPEKMPADEVIGSIVFPPGYFIAAAAQAAEHKTIYTGDIKQGSGVSTDDIKYTDVNGDGLPDIIYVEAIDENNSILRVRYNLGYGFGESELFDDSKFSQFSKIGIGGGSLSAISVDKGSNGTTAGRNTVETTMKLGYVDVNGDGLPDYIERNIDDSKKLFVRYNVGCGFTKEKYEFYGYNEELDLLASDTHGADISFFKSSIIPIPLFPAFGIIVNLGIGGGNSNNDVQSTFQDINGDGFVDHLVSNNTGDITAYINNTGKANLLESVARPLGGSIHLNYERTSHTQDMPNSRWILSTVTIDDGMGNSYKNSYKYENGYYDRKEREFYGFNRINETRPDNSTFTQEFYYKDYYVKGLMTRSILTDRGSRVYVTINNTYGLKNISEKIRFPFIEKKETRYYEGTINSSEIGTNPGTSKSTVETFSYDDFGNIISYSDSGDDIGDNDDVNASIGYYRNSTKYIIDKPDIISVSGSDGTVYRKRGCTYDSNGNLSILRQFINNGDIAETTIDYYSNGNIMSVTSPENHKGQRYRVAYNYDSTTQSRITSITDSFGYKSRLMYDNNSIYYGKPSETLDINNRSTKYTYDKFGRIVAVKGPYDQTGDPTISIEYNNYTKPAFAYVKNKGYIDEENTQSDPIRVCSFADGLRRIIQTKTDGEVDNSSRIITSGRTNFDVMGRISEQYDPFVEPAGNFSYNSNSDSSYRTRFYYDIFGRQTRIVYPDSTEVNNTYNIAAYSNGNDNGRLFKINTRDQENKQKNMLRDTRGNIRCVEEFGELLTIRTRYEYNPLNEITKVIDDDGNETRINYDNLGRRTSINNPDTGPVSYSHDSAGNITRKVTANLSAQGKAINYIYNYNRLQMIDYPDMNDVILTYGASNAGNQLGRIATIDNGIVSEERYYGLLGELKKSIKKINVAYPSPEVKSYETNYTFDTMGRMRSITFNDLERIVYEYNRGGLVKSVYSSNNHYYYVKNIEYNVYGQRSKVQYGNDVVSKFNYNNMRRLEGINTSRGDIVYQNLTYKYYDAGDVERRDNTQFATATGEKRSSYQKYEYNNLHQLVFAEGEYRYDNSDVNSFNNRFFYDNIGNILKKNQTNLFKPHDGSETTVPGTDYTYYYNYHNLKPHAAIAAGDRSFSYDDNGNMLGWTSSIDPASRMYMTWDEENRLARTFDGISITDYKYDPAGTRILKNGKFGEVVYVNNNYSIRNGEATCKHIFAGNTRVATKMILSDSSESVYYYHGDHLGSSSVITRKDGSYHEDTEYFPYGETWVNNKAIDTTESMPYKFTSKEQDPETGLYYYGARYYEPKISRWISTDPAIEKYFPQHNGIDMEKDDINNLPADGIYDPINLNMYSYTGNNPISYVDLVGNWRDPVNEPEIRSHQCGRFDPISNMFGTHNRYSGLYGHGAVDLRANIGQNVYAVGNGVVVRSEYNTKGYGQLVVYKFTYNYTIGNRLYDFFTGNWGGMRYKMQMDGKTFYAWNSHLIERDVKVGDPVKQGQKIARTGNTSAEGLTKLGEDHLHFGISDIDNPPGTNAQPTSNWLDPAPFFQDINTEPIDNRIWENPDPE